MEGHVIAVVRWYAGLTWRRLGWELAGSFILIVAAIALTWQAHRLTEGSGELRNALSDLAAKPQLVPTLTESEDTARKLDEFYAHLPAQEDIAVAVKQLFSLAGKNDVKLATGEYRPAADGTARVIKYQITLPVTGDIEHVEGFILGALSEIHALSLDGVTFKRESATTRTVDAHMRFTLIVRMP